MGCPYFKSGIVLGDRCLTTTGESYVSAELQFNDKLLSTWFERDTDENPFTGAFEYDTQLTYGYHTGTRSQGFDNPAEVTVYPSGRRVSTTRRGPRETLQSTWTGLTVAEAEGYTRFIQMLWSRRKNPGLCVFVDEDDNEIDVRIESYSCPLDLSQGVSRPYSISVSYSLEHTSEKYTFRSGGQIAL